MPVHAYAPYLTTDHATGHHAYINTYIHSDIEIDINIHMHIHMHANIRTHIHAYIQADSVERICWLLFVKCNSAKMIAIVQAVLQTRRYDDIPHDDLAFKNTRAPIFMASTLWDWIPSHGRR